MSTGCQGTEPLLPRPVRRPFASRVKEWGDELNRQWLEKESSRDARGIEKGFQRGVERSRREQVERQRALVRRLALRRFGPNIVESLGPLLDEVSDPDRIAAIAAGVLECETADEFLARAERREGCWVGGKEAGVNSWSGRHGTRCRRSGAVPYTTLLDTI